MLHTRFTAESPFLEIEHCQIPNLNLQEVPPPFQNPNLDKPGL